MWKEFWDIPEELENKSTDIIVLNEINNKKFIITHGHGRFLINPLAIVYDFGLKTALNVIDENKIKSADLFTPSEIALRTRKQSGKKTNIDEYEINIYNSLLKDISGKVKKEYEEYFKNIDGADSIKLAYKGSRNELIEVVEMLYDKYCLDDYKSKGFEWVDNFRIIKDKGLITILDNKLVDEINNKNDEIVLTFPEVLDKTTPVYYHYVGIEKGKRSYSRYPELDIVEQYYIKLVKNKLTITLEDLKRQQIISFDIHFKKDIYPQKVYQCIYFDFTHRKEHYFIESGTWYKVENNFIDRVNKEYKKIIDSSREIDFQYELPSISAEAVRRNKNKEYIFNERLTTFLNKINESIILDTRLVNRIEVRDILSRDESGYILFHNKYKYGSSALSHLFSQGYVSGENLTSTDFRKKANRIIDNPNLRFVEDGNFRREECTIVYGIITKRNRNGSFSIPLFSKINLNMFYKNITLLGYKSEVIFFEII